MADRMMTVKSLPSTYNKYLPEAFQPMLDGTKTVADSIQIATSVLKTMIIFPDKMNGALSADTLATDRADYLVRKGATFRDTHHISGQVVTLAEKEGNLVYLLSRKQVKGVDGGFGDDVVSCFDYERSMETRTAKGGTRRKSVEEQIEVIVRMMG